MTCALVALACGRSAAQPFSQLPHNLGSICCGSSAWADFDQDGDTDVLLADLVDANTEETRLFRNNGNGTFQLLALSPTRHSYYGFRTFWDDANRDGHLDMLITGSDEASLPLTWLFLQSSNQSFVDTGIKLTGEPLLWADLDNDGDLDILAGTAYQPGTCWLYWNQGQTNYTQTTPNFGTYLRAASAVDVDADGDLDLLIATSTTTARIYRNDGDGRFTDTGVLLSARAATPSAWADADGDGDLDLIGAGRGNYGILQPKVHRNDGNLLFADTNPVLPSSSGGTLRLADFDQDGDVDVLINARPEVTSGLFDPRPRLFFNDGHQQFTESTLSLPNYEGGGAEVMDLDDDSDVDFLISGMEFSTSNPPSRRLYRNNRTPPGSVPGPPTNLVAEIQSSRTTLRWSSPTGTLGRLSFALRVGTQPGAVDIISPLAAANGQRLVPGLGNAQASRRWHIIGLAPGTYYWSVQAVDHSFRGSAFAAETSFVVPEAPPPPPPPTISQLPHQFTDEDVAVPPLDFVVGPPASVSNLLLSVETSNPALTPASGLVLGGEATSRWLRLTPGTNQSGTSLVTVRVRDSANQLASSTFLLTVNPINDAPTLEPVPNQITYENSSALSVSLLAADAETNSRFLTYTASSSNPDLIPAAGLQVFSQSLTNNALSITPQTNRTGSAVVTLRASDGQLEASAAFVVTVLPQPFVPTADRLTNLNSGNVGWADFDGDRDLDLLLTGSSDVFWRGTARYFQNRGDGRMLDPGVEFEGWFRKVSAVVDYDRDDDMDAMLVGIEASVIGYSSAQVLRNNGSGGFTIVSNVPGLIPILDSAPQTAWGDVDNDGDLDMLYSRASDTRILLNRDASFAQSVALPRVTGYVALGDYDGDAVLDAALSGTAASGATTNVVLRGLGGGSFVASQIPLDQSSYGPVGFGDLNGDGLLDYWQVGFHTTSRSMILYRNLGNTQFAPPIFIPVALLDPSTIHWADFDGDGDLDFMIEVGFSTGLPGGAPNHAVGIYRNEGDFQFTFLGDPIPSAEARYLGIGDFDNDGDVDLSAAFQQTTRNIRVLTNRVSQPNPLPGAPTGLAARVAGGSVWLSWRPATDFNQIGGLTYNVRLGTRPGSGNVVPAMSLTNGYRQVVDFGNAGVRTNAFLTNLVGETFYWSVQAVDNSYFGGPFAPEQSFVVNLAGNQPPVIGEIADQITDEETPLTVAFTVNDDRTPSENLRLRAYPSNPFLLPVAGLRFEGSGTNRTLTLSPATNQFGQTLVVVAATDAAGDSATRSFLLTVSNVNDAPFISAIPNQTNLYSAEATLVEFVVQDSDSPLEQLQFSATSSNMALMPTNNVAFSGAGTNRTLTLRASAALEGETLITITGRDPDGAAATRSFLLVLRNQMFRLLATPFGGVRSGCMAWGDYDNDHDLDLALSGQGINQTAIYRNDGAGIFVKANTDLPNVDGGGVAWGDYDNDGDLDLLIGGRGQPSGGLYLRIYQNRGAGQFVLLSTNLPGRYGVAAWGDYDNDGRLDIVSSGETWDGQLPSTVVFHNNGSGVFQSVRALPNSVVNAGLFLSGGIGPWLDVNEDGKLDLLLSQFTGFAWQDELVEGDGNAQFKSVTKPWTGICEAWADFDNDGRPDVLESTGTRQDLRILLRQTSGALAPWGPSLETNWDPDSVSVGDFNNDGFLDVLSSGYEGDFNYRTRLLQNQTTGTWTRVSTPLLDFKFGSSAWADVDNDGDLDLLINGQRDTAPLQGYSTLLYRNDQPHTNSPPSAPSGLRAVFTADTVRLAWPRAPDADQTNGLTYNVRLGSSPGALDVISPMSAPSGFRLVPRPGNAGWLTWKLVRGLQRGQTYHWSVQSVDNSYAGSAFAPEASFTFGEPPLLAAIPDQAMDEDGVLSVPLSVIDPDGDVALATVSADSEATALVAAAGLSVSGTGADLLLRIQPTPDQHGATVIQVAVLDAQGGLATRSFTLTVRPVNDAPRVQDLNLTVVEDTPKNFTLMANDPEGDPLSFAPKRLPARGQLHGIAPTYTFVPRTNFFGSDWCEFQVADHHGAASVLRVSFDIVPVADVPEARLSIRLLSDGSTLMSLPAEPYQVYVIETSTDLVNWVADGTYLTLGGRLEFIGEPAPAGTARFYRARPQP